MKSRLVEEESIMRLQRLGASFAAFVFLMSLAISARAQNVTYKPYINLGDAGTYGVSDQMVVAWQTDDEDHGVNMVFNGHEHNYQRTYPLRAEAGAAAAPSPLGPPAVDIDTSFDGVSHTVPDGVLYLVEGAGGNRDFDNDFAQPRGSGLGVDQDDSATGTFTLAPVSHSSKGLSPS
jgi:hypothetical protein